MPELLWTASHVHDFIGIIYMHTATSVKLTCFSLPSHQQTTAYLWPSITNWFWCQSRINYYNSRWIANVCRVLCHLHRLRQNQKWSSYVIFKIVCWVLWSSTIFIIKSDDFYFNSFLPRSDPTNTTIMDTFCIWTCDTWKFMKNMSSSF